MVNHGMSKRYHYDHVGVNSRLDTIQAAILRVKLKHLDEFHSARMKLADRYDEALSTIPELKIPVRAAWSDHIFHQYTLQMDPSLRDELKNYLAEHDIPSMIYYPIPLHLQKAYTNLGYKQGDFPVVEDMCTRVLSLPMHTEMEEDQIDYIIHQITTFFSQKL
jgi:dTDP-4-amino-4,6-dideoxygalactose transaminase